MFPQQARPEFDLWANLTCASAKYVVGCVHGIYMVRIVTDTTSCLSPDAGRRSGITVVAQCVDWAEVRYREWIDISPEEFVERLKNSKEMPTSIPTDVEDFAAALRPGVEAGESVIFIGPSRKLSKTLDIVAQAAAGFPGADIRLVDTQLISLPNATLALLAAKWAADGQSADQIVQHLATYIQLARVFMLVPSLDFLARGGRIGGAAALLGKLLQFIPILTMHDGEIDQYELARTYRHAMVRIQDLVLDNAEQEEDLHLCVMHAGDRAQGQRLAQDLAWKLNLREVPLYDMCPTIACHTGPGALGISFFLPFPISSSS
jgi:DegV family protein with EDD domain